MKSCHTIIYSDNRQMNLFADRSVYLAMFPEELSHRLIKMFAFSGDTVLDPFMWSGTTSLAAKIGYEINIAFIEIAKQKLNTRQRDFMGTEYDFMHDTLKGDIAAAMEQLSYQFKDSQKTDPRKLTFGSRIEKESEAEREEFFTVKEILSPRNLDKLSIFFLISSSFSCKLTPT